MNVTNYIDSSALIGEGSKVWHFAVILDYVVIGRNCSVGAGAEIGVGCIIGEGTRIGSGVFLPPRSRVGRRVFIGPHVTCTDDRYPRVDNPDYQAEPPIIDDDASIGAGAILLPGVRIGRGALVAAGAVVTHDVDAECVVVGCPARLRERAVR